MKVNIQSEIAPLKRVLLHRPGNELLNLVPDYLPEMLFDDIPWLAEAQREHDAFAEVLRDTGAEVVYLKDLLAQSIKNNGIRSELTEEFLTEAGQSGNGLVREYLQSLSTDKMVEVMISGLRKSEISKTADEPDQYPFLLDPMPNMYFQRDPFSFVGSGVIVSKMLTRQRARENLFAKYIFAYHEDFCHIKKYYDRDYAFNIEGGDILVLDERTLAVGISERTHFNAIQTLAESILAEGNGFEQIVAIDIPKRRTFMHLDTVFTMIDKDTFSVHPNAQKSFTTLVLTRSEGKVNVSQREGSLNDILARVLNLERVKLIKCGGDSPIDAAREQWNDGANTLAVAPGEVVVYARNHVTNRLFEENGIKIHEIPCSELSRGRGGPRCMSMPIIRAY